MAKRELDPRLKELFKAGKKIYSISKANTINECLYEAYNAYVLHDGGKDGVYGILGTKIHDKLEEIINGDATAADLLPTLESELKDLDMLGIEFPKDRSGNNTIRDNWVADMTHFCKTFVPPKGKFNTEELFIYELDKKKDRYVQGYIDLIKENDDGSISIFDWKTSSDFSKSDLIHHGRQLVLYAIAKQAQGFVVKDVAWVMLKYCEVSFLGKNRSNARTLSPVTKVINRGKLVSTLKDHLEYDLFVSGFDDLEIECMMNRALKENSLDSLPEYIRERYEVKPYVRKYEITQELMQECVDYINAMADKFEGIDSSNGQNFPPRSFTKTNNNNSEVEDTFFCHVLCNYRNSCKHIKSFDEKQQLLKEQKDDDENLF